MTDQAKKIAATLIAHLKETGQTELLAGIVDVIVASSEYKNSRVRVTLTSAIELDTAELKGIISYLVKSVGSDYELTKIVDPSLVAGFTLQVNDTFIDASVLGKINTVSNKLTAKD